MAHILMLSACPNLVPAGACREVKGEQQAREERQQQAPIGCRAQATPAAVRLAECQQHVLCS
jgi:hypothetical protein